MLYDENMDEINEIKMLAAQKGVTLTYLADYLAKHYNKPYSIHNLSNKLRANTMRYAEMKLIAEALGMELKFIDSNS